MCRDSSDARTLLSGNDVKKAEGYRRYCAFCLVREECTAYGETQGDSRLYGDHNRPGAQKYIKIASRKAAEQRRRKIVEDEILKRPLTAEELAGGVSPRVVAAPNASDRVVLKPDAQPSRTDVLKSLHPSVLPYDWASSAPCRTEERVTDDYFVPESSAAAQLAVAGCVQCVSAEMCTGTADMLMAEYGIWGGEHKGSVA